MKIQINSLEALERLIGGDNQIEFDIRQNIVQEFTKKHLKAIANDDLMKTTSRIVSNEVQKEFFTTPNNYNAVLSPNGIKAIGDKIQELKYNLIQKMIEDAFDMDELRSKIDQLVLDQAQRITSYLGDANLNNKIDQLVDKKLKEKLGIK